MLVLSRGEASDGRRVPPCPPRFKGFAPGLVVSPIVSPCGPRIWPAFGFSSRRPLGRVGPELLPYGANTGIWTRIPGRSRAACRGRGRVERAAARPPALSAAVLREGPRPAGCRRRFAPRAVDSCADSVGCRSVEVESRTVSASVPPYSSGSLEAHKLRASRPLTRRPADAICPRAGSICLSRVRRPRPSRIRRSRVCLPTPDSRRTSVPLYLR